MSQPVALVYFTNARARAGVAEHILTLLRGLDRQRFRPLLVCPKELADRLTADVPPDVEIQAIDLRRPTQLRAAWRLAMFLRDRRAGILHSHLFQSSVLASPIGWLCRVPLVLVTAHGREEAGSGWRPRWLWELLAGRFVKRCIAVSNATGAYLLARKRIAASKVKVIQNGCDLERFFDREAEGLRLRAELGFAPDALVLIVLGRLVAAKGHRVLLDAMPSILSAFPQAQLVCVGEGELRGTLERQAGALGITGHVHFAGYQKNVPAWLAMANLSVVPSFEEGLPLAAIESLAAACPVVATAVDGCEEVILHEKTGLVVPPGDAPALSGAVCRMLADAGLREDMALAGRQWVFEKFSQERQVQRTQELYAKELGLPAVRVGSVNPQKAVICEEVSRLCAEEFGGRLRAVVLTGGFARDEAPIVPEGEGWRVMGDTPCLLVFHRHARPASSAEIHRLCKRLDEVFSRRDIRCRVAFRAMRPASLRRLKPGIFAYELMAAGQVIWGDAQVLGLIPRFQPDEIPREDAWRLLQEAMLQVLFLTPELPGPGQRLSRNLQYRVVNLYLDMATSLLVFAGAYAPSYAQRLERLSSMAYRFPSREGWPFSLEDFTQQVAACAQISLLGAEAICGSEFWEDAVAAAHQLWRWELAQLTGIDVEASDAQLLHAWIDLEPRHTRLRAWLHLARRLGRVRVWHEWSRWMHQISLGSPGYRIYAAAAEVLFRLPQAVGGDGRAQDWSAALAWLPLPPSRDLALPSTWWQVIEDIALNYREVLGETRE